MLHFIYRIIEKIYNIYKGIINTNEEEKKSNLSKNSVF